LSKELLPNTSLSHYRIVSKIGAGGMGEVYLAEDTRLDRQVALKILPQEFAEDSDRMNRFVREAKSASALNQPNIITIHEIGEAEGTHFIASEYIQGETLHTRLKQTPLDLKTTLDIAIQVASALNAAHKAGIIHRDIKPENVMIRPDGLVKILDFGIAKLSTKRAEPTAEEAATALKQQGTSPGVIIGTANYMSPEQARGKAVNAQSDIFSFGIVLYEMVTGQRAFTGENAVDVIGAILHKEPTPLTQLAPELPHEIERIINKTLRKDPDVRYQTAGDLLTDLKDAKQELEFQDKLERAVAPQSQRPETQTIFLPATDGQRSPTLPTSSAEFITQEVKKHKLGVMVGSLLVVALLGVGLWFFYFRVSAANKTISSIAVLPFQNKSSDADTDYLSDGLAESLIYRLSQLPNLKVSPTSAVMRYKGKELDAQQIAKELGVQAVMSGRMIQRGENLSISVELVDAANNKIIWGEQYERKMSDLLTTQREIATTITEKLQLKLSGENAKGITKKYTESNEAYQLYLKGRYLWNQRTGESLKRATEFYNQAIEKDPGFALAYAALAETYVLFANYEVSSPADSMPQSKAAALRALELDDSLAEAHSALGWYLCQYEFDWIGGEKEFRRAIELNPNYATAHQWLASVFAQTKRFDAAQAEIKRASDLDPLSPIIAVNVAFDLWESRRYDEALKQFERTLLLHPDFTVAQQGLCWTYSAMGKSELAITACRKSLDLTKGAWDKGRLSMVLGSAGHTDEAKKLLQELQTESSQRYIPKMALALAHLGLNQKAEALAMIEQDVAEHGYWVGSMGVEPEFDELRSEPRFKALIKRANLPE
jgi:serine/threonine-protein kinase